MIVFLVAPSACGGRVGSTGAGATTNSDAGAEQANAWDAAPAEDGGTSPCCSGGTCQTANLCGRGPTAAVDAGIGVVVDWDAAIVHPDPIDAAVVEAAPASICSDLVPGGPSVLVVFKAGPPPDMGQGGAIVDGVYDMTATTIYRSTPTSQQFYERATIRISGGAKRIEIANEGASPLVESIAPMGASLNPTTTCPPDQGRSFGPNYTATFGDVQAALRVPGQFILVNGLYVEVFAMRP